MLSGEHIFCSDKNLKNLSSDLKSLLIERALFKIELKWYINTHKHGICWQYWCVYVDVFLNSLMCNHCVFLCENFSYTVHMFLYLCDIFHILESLWRTLDIGNVMQCNTLVLVHLDGGGRGSCTLGGDGKGVVNIQRINVWTERDNGFLLCIIPELV
jgi:hypothetical protein